MVCDQRLSRACDLAMQLVAGVVLLLLLLLICGWMER